MLMLIHIVDPKLERATNADQALPFVLDCMDAGVRATQEQLPRALSKHERKGLVGIHLKLKKQ
jgi:hypothetical protein